MVPVPNALADEIRSFQARLKGIGESWLFPCEDRSGPWSRDIFGQQLRLAEEKAGLQRLKGGVWHPYRRKWATERKDRPIVDVKAAGGWRDTNTLLGATNYGETTAGG